jgi:hypothetical protein
MSALSTAAVGGGLVNVGSCHLAQVPPADLYIPVLGQLPPAQLPLGDALEPGSLEIVGFDGTFGVGRSDNSR